jgi:phosphoglucosamine mutase
MKYFGTDGIRGKALVKLTPELAFKVGQSLKPVINPKMIIIGGDTRQSSPLLGLSIANGAMLAGIDVLYCGITSTPMLAHYAKVNHALGIMITASHNPFTDNGIKIFHNETKLANNLEIKIEDFIDSNEIIKSPTYGSFRFVDDVEETYLKLYNQINMTQTKFKVGYDSANGANYLIAKKVFDIIAPNSTQIGNTPDGLNINKGVGSMHLESISSLVKTHHLDFGFAFDGDADRLNLVDQNHIYDGDFIVYMIGKYLKSKNQLPNNKVVLTKMSNPGMLEALNNLGIGYTLTDVGDKYVLDSMLKEGLVVGGESSGHILLTHLIHSGDGLLAATYLLSILTELNMTPKEYTKEVKLYPLKTINIPNVSKDSINHPIVINVKEEVLEMLGDKSLLLLRPSGTEPLIRLTVSHENSSLVEKAIETLRNVIEEVNR